MARSGFAAFPGSTRILRGLARNNRREWFSRGRRCSRLGEAAHARTGGGAEPGAGRLCPGVRYDPEKAIFRIYRDVRFSKDKKPYKEHIAASSPCAVAWPMGTAVSMWRFRKRKSRGGGVYMPEPLRCWRFAITSRTTMPHSDGMANPRCGAC